MVGASRGVESPCDLREAGWPGCLIEWASHGQPASLQDVCVDHRRFQVLVSEEILDGADVVAGFEQVGGERMAQRVAGGAFGQAGGSGGAGHGALQAGGAEVMPGEAAGARIASEAAGGEDELPAPVGGRVEGLLGESVGQGDGAQAEFEVGLVQLADVEQVIGEGGDEAFGEDRDAVLQPLAIADGNLKEVEIEVLDAQAQAFHQAQTAAVQEAGEQEVRPGQVGEQALDLGAAEDGWDAARAAGADVLEGQGDLGTQHVAVEEEQGGEGLILGRCGDLHLDGQVGQEGFDFRGAHGGRMTLVMEEDEAADPGQVRVFGAQGVVLAAKGLAVRSSKRTAG